MQLNFAIIAYHIMVDGFNGTQGDIQLNLQMAKAALIEPVAESRIAAPTNLWLRTAPIDIGGKVARVDFFEGTNWLGSVTNRPFDLLWENAPVGDHAITVRAIDELGGETIAPPVNIHIRWRNDDFANRIVLNGTNLTVEADNSEATSESGEENIGGWPPLNDGFVICVGCPKPSFNAGKTMWWTWTAPVDGVLMLDESGDNTLPLVSVLTGDTITNLIRLAHNGFSACNRCQLGCSKDLRAQTSLFVTNGQVCIISMDSIDPVAAGERQFQLRFQPPPANDDFDNRQVLTGLSVTASIANLAATGEAGEPNPSGNAIIHSVWYSWTAPQSGRVKLAVLSPQLKANLMNVIVIWPNPRVLN